MSGSLEFSVDIIPKRYHFEGSKLNVRKYIQKISPPLIDFFSTGVESTNGNSACLSVCLSVCPSSLLIFLIHTLSSRNLPQSTLVTQPLRTRTVFNALQCPPSMSPMLASQLVPFPVNWSPYEQEHITDLFHLRSSYVST